VDTPIFIFGRFLPFKGWFFISFGGLLIPIGVYFPSWPSLEVWFLPNFQTVGTPFYFPFWGGGKA